MKMKWKTTMLLTAALAFGCGDATPDEEESSATASCSGGKCDSSGFEVIHGGIWAVCAMTPGADSDMLVCAPLDGEVLQPSVVITEARNGRGELIANGIHRPGSLDSPAQIPHDAYPVDLEIRLGFGTHNINGFRTTSTRTRMRLDSADDMVAGIAIEQPFDLWRIQLATRETFAILEMKHTVGTDQFVNHDGEPSGIVLSPRLTATTDVVDALVAVPQETTPVLGEAIVGDGATTVAVAIGGPGRYVAALGGIDLATDADSALFGDADEPDNPIEPPVEPEPVCDFDYATWLAAFTPVVGTADGAALVGELPCTPVDSVHYADWLAVFEATLEDGAPRSNSNALLDDSELDAVQQVLKGRPDSADEASYAAAHQLFRQRFDLYVPQGNLSGAIIDDRERTILDVVIDARPRSVVSDTAYNDWFTQYDALFRTFVPRRDSPLDQRESSILDTVVAMMPQAAGETSYQTWFQLYTHYYDMFVNSPLDDTERARLAVITAVRPHSSSTAAYEQWLSEFGRHLSEAGSSLDDGERDYLIALGDVKPCVADITTAQTAADGARAAVSDHSDFWEEVAAAQACEQVD